MPNVRRFYLWSEGELSLAVTDRLRRSEIPTDLKVTCIEVAPQLHRVSVSRQGFRAQQPKIIQYQSDQPQLTLDMAPLDQPWCTIYGLSVAIAEAIKVTTFTDDPCVQVYISYEPAVDQEEAGYAVITNVEGMEAEVPMFDTVEEAVRWVRDTYPVCYIEMDQPTQRAYRQWVLAMDAEPV